MTQQLPDELDDLFHLCAFRAYLTVAAEQQDWPDCEATRRLAFNQYEEELRRKNEVLPSKDRPGSRVSEARATISA